MTDGELSISHEIFVPREIIFELWTSPEHLEQWNPPYTGVDVGYAELIAPEKLVYATGRPGIADMASEVHVKFEDLGGMTRITIHQAPLASAEALAEQEQAWELALDRLTEYLSVI